MIRYTLVCDSGHDFESWFPSSDGFDEQAARGLVTCPFCDSAKIAKAPMAPALGRGRREVATVSADAPAADAPVPMIAEPERKLREMLRAMREHVTKNAEHVGPRFATEARAMHYGDTPHRSIYGEASPDEARAMLDEGIDVCPLPPAPDDRN